MLKKIACIVVFVEDMAQAVAFYADVFGLKPLWQDDVRGQAGLLFPESDAEIVLRTDPQLAGKVEVQYLVDNVEQAVQRYVEQGCKVLVEPFRVRSGQCAVIQDPFGTRLCLLDLSKAAQEVSLF